MPSSFAAVRITLRASLIAALLIFTHVVTSIMAGLIGSDVLPPTLGTTIQGFSSLTSLTLLWVAFTALELAEPLSRVACGSARPFWSSVPVSPFAPTTPASPPIPAAPGAPMSAIAEKAHLAGLAELGRAVSAPPSVQPTTRRAGFSCTVIEFVLNSAALAGWASMSTTAVELVRVLAVILPSDMVAVVAISLAITYATLFLLHAHLVFSLALYAARMGTKKLFTAETWTSRTGEWPGRIELGDEDA
ncbi:hypothetical protein Q5752_006248 [Cryptotrichosporon argae]